MESTQSFTTSIELKLVDDHNITKQHTTKVFELFEDHHVTVNTSSPDLTECFQNTLLVWIPCGYMFLLVPFYFLYLAYCTRSYIKHTWLNITKTVLCCLICAICICDIAVLIYQHSNGETLYPASILAPACRFLATSLAVSLIQLGRKKGVQSTGTLFIYWLLHVIAAVFILSSKLKIVVNAGSSGIDVYNLISFSLFTLLVVVELVLSALVDSLPVFSVVSQDKNVCPEGAASFLSELTFWWFTSLIVRGYKKSLEKSDLWSLNEWDKSKAIVPQFEKQWQKEVEKSQRSQAIYASKQKASLRDVKDNDVQLKPLKEENGEVPKVQVEGKTPKGVHEPKLALSLIKAYGVTFICGSLLKLLHDVMMFISPQLLRYMIQFISAKDDPAWHGYILASLMFIVAFIQSMILHQYFHRCFLVGMRVRTALIAAVYQKSLNLSNKARKTSTVGEIVNLMSVDAQRFMELTTYLNMIWSAPFQMCVCMYFLWQTLGPSVLAGVGILVLLIPVNALIARKNKKLQQKQMKYKDSRIKLMNEILNGIKVLKLYAWELSFQAKVLNIRDKELKVLRKAAYLNAASSFTWTCAPFLVSLTTFAVYVMSSPDNILDAEKAFVSLALFNILRFPISMLPMLIASLVQASVSVKRLQKFLKNEELDPKNIDILEKSETSNTAINVENGTFTWDGGEEEKITLKDISMQVKSGSLVAVVGQVGTGKSSLLSAILGELEKVNGKVEVQGSVAYVAQQAWIQNATLKENILFGSGEKEKIYDQVLESCALKPDLEILPGGDMTEIGEKGINLSGGQKQRVSLARAVYSDADIYLLDDPLSAVDAHVGKHIFDKVIGPEGMLRKKTRVLVTHGLGYLPQMDQIVVLVDGQITEVGTYKELVEQQGAFSDFLKTYMTEQDEEIEDNPSDDEYEYQQEVMSDIGSAENMTDIIERKVRIRTETIGSCHNTPKIHRRKRQTTNTGSMRSLENLSGLGSQASIEQFKEKEKELLEKAIKDKEARDKEKLIQAERSETGRVKFKVFAAYIKSVGYIISLLILLLYILNNAAQVGANFWLSTWADESVTYINGTMDPSRRDMYLGVYGALGLAQGIFVVISAFVMANASVLASSHIHKSLLFNCLRSPTSFYDTTPVGRIVNRFSKDTDTVDDLIPRNMQNWCMTTTKVMATLAVVSYSTPVFLAAAIPLGIIYFLIQRFYVATSRQLKRLESVSRSPIYSHFGETIQGATTIRAYRQQNRFITESEDKVDENQACYYPSIVSNRWLAVRLEFVGNCIVLFAAMFAVIGKNHLSPGIVGLSITYALNITQTLNWMVRMTSELETNIVAVERVKEYSETPTEAEWEIAEKKPDKSWPAEGNVSFKQYSTRYREGLDLVLKDICCNVDGGEKIGIVGRTGAGKSSLTLALFRIIEAASGNIIIDGLTISELGLHDLRSKLTIIPQDPVLFSGPLRMNLDPFDRHSDEAIWTALEQAHLKSFVSSLTEGLMYECTEGGDNLSVGQRQLVCLARALLRKTKVLVLDEATAAVDLETDDLIQSTIRNKFKECTVLTIAHRLNTIMDYTRILVLDQGEIAEFDTPDNLLTSKSSIFYNMAKDAGLVDKDTGARKMSRAGQSKANTSDNDSSDDEVNKTSSLSNINSKDL